MPQFYVKLKKFYDDKLKQNYMDGFTEEVSLAEYFKDPGWLLPHLPVFRNSIKTPLRICFDASAMFKGFSLNTMLYKGPNVYGNIFDILLRFRRYDIAINGDITKMFNQILLDYTDRKYHRFIWRSNINESIHFYFLLGDHSSS